MDGGGMETDMERQRHKRKESFSILLTSNTGGNSRQFHLSVFWVRLFFSLFFLLCIAAIAMAVLYSNGSKRQEALRVQIREQEQRLKELEAEMDELEEEKVTLVMANEELQKAEEEQKELLDAVPEKDTSIPTLYPYSGTGILISSYTADQQYLAINARPGGNVVAAGDGKVITVGSDETYPSIIEVDHGGGYITRYLCRRGADIKLQEGAQVKAGDALYAITDEDTELNYQVIFEGEAIDPLTVIEAKG